MNAEHRGGLAGEVGADQVVLALEEPVDRHLAQAGLADQLVHADAARAAAGEEPLGGVEDDRLPLGAAAADRGRDASSAAARDRAAVTQRMVHHIRDGAVRGTPRVVALGDEGRPGSRGAGEPWGRCGDGESPTRARAAARARTGSVAADAAGVGQHARDGRGGRLLGLRDSSVCASAESSATRMSRCVSAMDQLPPGAPRGNSPGPVILVAIGVRSRSRRAQVSAGWWVSTGRGSAAPRRRRPTVARTTDPGEHRERDDEEARRQVDHRREHQPAPHRRRARAPRRWRRPAPAGR